MLNYSNLISLHVSIRPEYVIQGCVTVIADSSGEAGRYRHSRWQSINASGSREHT